MKFEGLDKIKLTKLVNPLSAFPAWTSGHDTPAQKDDTTNQAPPKQHHHHHHPKLRMRNVFAAPLELATNTLEDLKELVHHALPKTAAQTELLEHALGDHFVFSHLTKTEQKYMMGALTPTTVLKGTTIIQQGVPGQYLYILESGKVQFVVDDRIVGTTETPGTVFGELSLLYDSPTAASVLASDDCHLWKVSQHVFRRIKAAHVLDADLAKRQAVEAVPFFQSLSPQLKYQLAEALQHRKYKRGDVLMTKGNRATTMFILQDGWIQGTNIQIGKRKMADIRLGKGCVRYLCMHVFFVEL